MSSSKFETFFKGISLYDFKLQVPDVVIDEVVNKYKYDLEKSINENGKITKTINRLTETDLQPIKIDVESEVKKYRKFLTEKVKELDGEILPYPVTDNKLTVEFILNRVHPFQGGEKGFRDYLIIKSMIPKEISLRDRFIFVTENISDFGKEPFFFDDMYEHYFPEYRSGIFSGRKNKTFEVRNSLSSLNKEFFEDALENTPFNTKQLKKYGLDSFDFMSYFQLNLNDHINFYYIGHDLFEISANIGTIHFSELLHINSFEIVSITELLDPKLLIDYTISLAGVFDLGFSYEDFLNDEGVRTLIGQDEDEEPFVSVVMNQESELSISGKIVFETQNMRVIENELFF